MPVLAAPSFRPGVDVKNRSASVVPGCCPLTPSAPRSRSVLMNDASLKNGSSETSHETLALG